MRQDNFACSLCGSRDWPRPGAQCPLCADETPDARLEDAREDETADGKKTNVYLERAAGDFGRGVVCMIGCAVLALLCGCSALGLAAVWAVGCGCGAVFCWFGAQVYFHDAAINRRKARWRQRPDDFPY